LVKPKTVRAALSSEVDDEQEELMKRRPPLIGTALVTLTAVAVATSAMAAT
jgi:hypothetical protein